MTSRKHIKNENTVTVTSLAVYILAALVIAVSAFAGFTFADESQSETVEPIRVVHQVKVEDKEYCFFVQHNAVLTPADLVDKETGQPLSDDAVADLILERSGLYMKEANCNESSHTVITMEDWKKKDGCFVLGADAIKAVREAAVNATDGAPVKLNMDLSVTTEPIPEKTTPETPGTSGGGASGDGTSEGGASGDGSDTPGTDTDEPTVPMYSTYKLTGQELLFVVVATPNDAKKTEEVCDPVKTEDTTTTTTPTTPTVVPKKKLPVPKVPATPKEELPEFKTIKMVNRAGGPLEDTLKPGDPVSLEWIEPHRHIRKDDNSFFGRFPGGFWGFIAMLAAAAGLIALIVAAVKRRMDED